MWLLKETHEVVKDTSTGPEHGGQIAGWTEQISLHYPNSGDDIHKNVAISENTLVNVFLVLFHFNDYNVIVICLLNTQNCGLH